jgi:hypothetical protein
VAPNAANFKSNTLAISSPPARGMNGKA